MSEDGFERVIRESHARRDAADVTYVVGRWRALRAALTGAGDPAQRDVVAAILTAALLTEWGAS